MLKKVTTLFEKVVEGLFKMTNGAGKQTDKKVPEITSNFNKILSLTETEK